MSGFWNILESHCAINITSSWRAQLEFVKTCFGLVSCFENMIMSAQYIPIDLPGLVTVQDPSSSESVVAIAAVGTDLMDENIHTQLVVLRFSPSLHLQHPLLLVLFV